MANVNRPHGFVPIQHLSGGVIRATPIRHKFASAYAANVFSGDVLKLADTGLVQVAAAAETNLLGVFAGVQWTYPDGRIWFSRYWPTGQTELAGTSHTLFLYDDPNIIYEVQAYTATTGYWTQTMVGNNADLKANTAGNTMTGQSGMELDLDSIAATTKQFRILGVVDAPDNDSSGVLYTKLKVKMVETIMAPAGTIGI
jgi:hypothetical protein